MTSRRSSDGWYAGWRPSILRGEVFRLSLLALALLIQGGGAHPIVFTRGAVLFVRNGGDERSLGQYGTNPAWSSDGRTIAFEYGADIYVVRRDGTERHLLVRGAMHPAWASDGRIAFTSTRGGNLDVTVADADGGNARRLTHGLGVDETPSWSPDSRQIVYTSQRWCAVRTLASCSTQIFVMDADGHHKRRLTSGWFSSIRPRYSPDGRRLVWLHAYVDYYDYVLRSIPSSRYVVVVARSSGRGAHAVTSERVRAWAPTFSPNGATILFSVEERLPPWRLAVVGVRGGRLRIVSHADRDDSGADWLR
jgi:Tol biopolymer transport system component